MNESTYDVSNASLHGGFYIWELKRSPPMLVFLAVAYSLVFTLSLVGNAAVIATVCRIPSMHTTVNYLICNLSMADILMAILCLPLNFIANTFTHWVTGRLLCKAMPYLQGVAVAASVTTLSSIAFDRYLAVCRPLRRHFSKTQTLGFLAGLWSYVLVLLLPWAINYDLVTVSHSNRSQLVCLNTMQPEHNRAFQCGVVFALMYAAPLAFIAVCYGLVARKLNSSTAAKRELYLRRSSGAHGRLQMRRLVKMLATVVAIFALSWLPLHTVALLYFFRSSMADFFRRLEPCLPVIQWLAISNCCVNPWIYCAFSKSYRANFFSTLRCLNLPASASNRGFHHPTGSALRRRSSTVGGGCGGCGGGSGGGLEVETGSRISMAELGGRLHRGGGGGGGGGGRGGGGGGRRRRPRLHVKLPVR